MIRAVTGVDLVLVTPDNLGEWLVDDSPLHPAYEDLSLIHRSDYLRGYLMHHHGGGYIDIKQPLGSWVARAFSSRAWSSRLTTMSSSWRSRITLARVNDDVTR